MVQEIVLFAVCEQNGSNLRDHVSDGLSGVLVVFQPSMGSGLEPEWVGGRVWSTKINVSWCGRIKHRPYGRSRGWGGGVITSGSAVCIFIFDNSIVSCIFNLGRPSVKGNPPNAMA